MKKLFFMMALVFFLCSGLLGGTAVTERLPLFGMPKACAFETLPVNFVVIDRTGSVTRADMRGWTTFLTQPFRR